MNSVLKDKTQKKEVFPKLMIYKSKEEKYKTVILATDKQDSYYRGFVVHCDIPKDDVDALEVGYFSLKWSDSFKDYNGTVKLSN